MEQKSNSNSKKSLIATVLAVVIAATAIIGGGTYAYLQDETEDVVNEFDTNEVLVDLTETTGSDYSIIPGTSQAKDPKVTVTNTVDAIVFVTVTDNTDGLVSYEIADGWTKLNNVESNVYYRRVAADAEVKEFSVLKDDSVTYDPAILNSDMVDEDGNLKEDIALTFKASAIQDTFGTGFASYIVSEDVNITNETMLVVAALTGAPITIGEDFTVSSYNICNYINDADLVDIDLNGHTITLDEAWYAGVSQEEQNIKISNGTIILNDLGTFYVNKGSSLTLENVEVISNVTHTINVMGEDATVNVIDSSIEQTVGGFIISTNANSTSNYNVVINVQNSTLTCDYTDGWTSTAILVNVPCELTIDNSTIIGERQAVLVRGGTAVITNSTLSRPYALTQSREDSYLNTVWGGNGNTNIPYATLVIGNRYNDTKYYNYPSDVTLDNVTLTAYNEDGVAGKTLYMYGNTEDTIATLTYTNSNCSLGEIIQGNENTVVNVK
jgi:predicted ribosomally synthesized peptide with SipW-like signal peptide